MTSMHPRSGSAANGEGQAPAIEIRKARGADIPAMRAMQERSMAIIGSRYYARDAMERFIRQIGTMEDAVVAEGHFFVAFDAERHIVGSGGWSRLKPHYAQFDEWSGAAQDESEPASTTATVRSVYVAPEWTRRGIARAIMQRVEADAARSDLVRLQLTAPLSGEALYRSIGYRSMTRSHVTLPDGTRLGCVSMEKRITP